MNDAMIRKAAVFSVWCMTISIGIRFLQSDVWNTIKHMTPEETFALVGSFTLSPNATIFVKTKEEIHIPGNLCGHIGEKNSRMREGLWVSGPTHFPGHKTFIFLRVRNVSQNEITIKAGDRIAQISFEKLMEQPDRPYNTLSNASLTKRTSIVEWESTRRNMRNGSNRCRIKRTNLMPRSLP